MQSKVHTCGLGSEGGQGSHPRTPALALSPAAKPAGTLPKMIRGSIHVQWVKCGRPNCRCNRGDPHGPYYYLFQWIGGRLRKTYVSRKRLPEVAAAVESYHDICRKVNTGWPRIRSGADALRLAQALGTGNEQPD